MEIHDLYEIFKAHPVVTTDSRDCPEGSMFFALKGEKFNGNAYAKSALDKGCSCAVIDEPEYEDKSDSRIILVADVLKALQGLARHHRRTLGTKIIGITGTNGKTTTKELVAAVLSKKYNVLYTQGNFNNHIGVPKTLLGLKPEHELAVVEMGANHPGEIKTLVDIAEPDCGLITNVGKAHLLGFGSFEGVIKTKGELYDFLRQRQGAEVFINNDNPHLKGISSGLRLIKYGQEEADGLAVRGQLTACDPYLRFAWKGHDKSEHEVATKLVGAYNLDNALAAITVGERFGVAPADIDKALEEYTPSNNRSQLLKTAHNTLIVDAYNANPTSMAAALANFRLMDAADKMCILGDMKELGEASRDEHSKVVKATADCGFSHIWFVGDEFGKCVREELSPEEAERRGIELFDNVGEVKRRIAADMPKGHVILVKGSNSTRLVDIVGDL